MPWNVCKYPECESWSARPDGDYCETHRRSIVKEQETLRKSEEKRRALLSKPKKVYAKPSKNPKDWSNTFLCSDGTRVTQEHINKMMVPHRTLKGQPCEGCLQKVAKCKAHIIPRSRCKVIGKTELIWEVRNMFDSCFECNSAIENPKGTVWKNLKNIDQCIQFIYDHDKELYFKFEAQGWSRLATEEPKI